MLKSKRGASIISLALCAVTVGFVIAAVVVAVNNSATLRAQLIADSQKNVVESSAYTKVYEKYEVVTIARQAFANNYLQLYDGKVDLEGFKALVIGEMMQTIPMEQLEEYNITITEDSISVE